MTDCFSDQFQAVIAGFRPRVERHLGSPARYCLSAYVRGMFSFQFLSQALQEYQRAYATPASSAQCAALIGPNFSHTNHEVSYE
jgi:hypothetical protein